MFDDFEPSSKEVPNKPRIAPARNMARKLIKDSGAKMAPILLNDIVGHLKQEHQVSIHGFDFGDNISGILIVEKDGSTIGYNDTQHVHRNRFTVAHEIGHLLFNHTCSGSGVTFEDSRIHEKEAHEFAAELLMPLDFLKKDLKSGMKDFQVLAKRYWVSEEALGWRIANPQTKLLNYI